MRKLFIVLFSVFSLAILAQQKPKIAVYVTGDDAMNEIIANRMMAGFINSGKYMPVERSADFLKAVNKEHAYERTGEVDEEQIAQLGVQFGIQYICVVSVLDVWDNEKHITARILDATSAEVIGSCSSNSNISSGNLLLLALNDLTDKLQEVLDYSKQSNTKRVAIYVTRTGNKHVDIILGDELVAAFAQSEEYVAIERTNAFLKQIQRESGYQSTGAVNDDDLLRLGKRFGVQYVCVAKTIPYGGKYFISARLVDVETAEVPKMYNAENMEIDNSEDVVNVAKLIAAQLTDGDYFYVQQSMPEFPGGADSLRSYLNKELKYPVEAQENGIQGTVVCRIVIDIDGSIIDVKVVKSVCEDIDNEAVRVIQAMPKWTPGLFQGRPTKVGLTLPLRFRLE